MFNKLKEFYDTHYWTGKQLIDQTLHGIIGFLVLLPVALTVDNIPVWAGSLTGLLSDVRMEWKQYPWHAWYDGPLDLLFYGIGGALCALIIS